MDFQATRARIRDYEILIDTMHCGLLGEDEEGRIAFINQRLLDWLGYSQDEVVGKPIEMLAPPELKELLDEDLTAAQEGDLRARLLAARRKDSTTFPIVTIPQRLVDDEGRFEGLFSIVVDLGALLTAKPVGPVHGFDLRTHLSRIALEIQSVSLCLSGAGAAAPILPLQHPELRDLSAREGEVLAMLVAGSRVPAIAKQLHISPHTVRNHLKSMFRKLGVSSQSDLIERVRALSGQASEERPAG